MEINNEKLIRLVQKNPEIYDQSLKSYRDKDRKADIWQVISAKMGGIPVNKCKSRWNNLRDRYKKGAKGGTRRWKLFPLLSFLNPTIVDRPQSPAREDSRHSQDSEVILDMSPVEYISDEEQELPGTSSPSISPPILTAKRVKRGRKRKHSGQPVNGERTSEFEDKLMAILCKQNDEDELWCLSLAPKLKHMSDEQKSRFQMCVSQLLHEIRFSDAEEW